MFKLHAKAMEAKNKVRYTSLRKREMADFTTIVVIASAYIAKSLI